MYYVGTGRLGAAQNVAFSATPGIVANGVDIGVSRIRIVVTTDAWITTDGTTPSATNGAYLPALSPEYFTMTSGQKAAAAQVSAAGMMNVVEII